MWSRQSDRDDLPDTSTKFVVSADSDIFPNIRILLVLVCNLPVTSAEAARTFFVLGLF